MNGLSLEPLTAENLPFVRMIDRSDVPLEYVDGADVLWELTQYGQEHHCLGCTFAVKYGEGYIGALLIGEAIPWETDPPQMQKEPFWRLMCFVMDRAYRGRGLGSQVLEMAVSQVYSQFGVRPIALGCHRENVGAARFYERHGFKRTGAMEGNDIYFLRYPPAGQ